ncbi:D-inositol-3-phosphate glycosyltransferase [Synechococcus sp. CBW1107]|nr:D-inositol-3-phosphate glycosyltransferase [Synechococcus sp. CBW1107]
MHRIGPYHRARFAALAVRCPLVVLETRPHTREYPWESQSTRGYQLEQLQGQPDPDRDPPSPRIDRQLDALIARHTPRALISVGWADRSYQRLLLAAHRHRLPLLLVSDSRQQDGCRTPMGELPKRLLLAGFSAALVAGRQSRAYLQRLGFPPEAIVQPWDVVDNQAWYQDDATLPLEQRQPPHWLCVSRFVAKKNHRTLLEAFARYQRAGGRWGLHLIGEGPLETSIRDGIAALPEPAVVWITPFQQFTSLRKHYHAARGLILASRSDQWGLVVNEAMAAGLPVLVSQACGCAPDLIADGRTGFLLDPHDAGQIAAQLSRFERLSPAQLGGLTAAAAAAIKTFEPETFAAALERAVARACRRPRFSRRACLTAGILALRP